MRIVRRKEELKNLESLGYRLTYPNLINWGNKSLVKE